MSVVVGSKKKNPKNGASFFVGFFFAHNRKNNNDFLSLHFYVGLFFYLKKKAKKKIANYGHCIVEGRGLAKYAYRNFSTGKKTCSLADAKKKKIGHYYPNTGPPQKHSKSL